MAEKICYHKGNTEALRENEKEETYMREQHLAETIAALRKKHGVTQEQMGKALGISPQAISKWENGTCLPDTQTLPLIADFFRVSVDYLFYGSSHAYDDLQASVQQKVVSHPQMSVESYEEALGLFAAAHHGISHGNLRGEALLYDEPAHLSSEGGVSLLSGKGYGALVTRRFFESFCAETVRVSHSLLRVLADENRLRVVMAILSMSEISIFELREKTGMQDEELSAALQPLLEAQLVLETVSKHQSLGKTYAINIMCHNCLCILLATLEMQRLSYPGIACCISGGDFPIDLQK